MIQKDSPVLLIPSYINISEDLESFVLSGIYLGIFWNKYALKAKRITCQIYTQYWMVAEGCHFSCKKQTRGFQPTQDWTTTQYLKKKLGKTLGKMVKITIIF
jgi:hypothetical protein